jgi:ADP-ribose pyrophosphatase YjhB (NUDIX family)
MKSAFFAQNRYPYRQLTYFGESMGAQQFPPQMTVCVGAVILHENKIMMVRQAKGHSLEGQWSIPWGFIDHEERPEVAALREVQEEAGVTADLKGLLGIQNMQPAGWLAVISLCQHIAGTPQPDGVETDAAAYLSVEEINSMPDIEIWCKWLGLRVLAGDFQVIAPALNNPYQPHLAFL